MQVITAPEPLVDVREPTVFLAGGITNCPWWQDEVISMLANYEGVIYNPRRRDFPIHDPNAAQEQITWEFDALNRCKIFSMWFSNADSDQPICMFELGRHLTRFDMAGDLDRVVIGVEPGYRREQDVRIQTSLINPKLGQRISSTLEKHAANIAKALEKF